MGKFTDLRETLADDLAVVGVPVYPEWPDVVVAPCVFLVPPFAGSYVTGGRTFGEAYVLSIDVVILVAHGPVDAGYAQLETLIEAVLANSVDWSLGGVDAPSPVTVTENGAEYLGTVVHLSKPTRL